MKNDPLTKISTRRTPQREQADPRQIKNHAGGYAFAIDDEMRIRRFLILGTSGGTYYAGERKHTKDNAEELIRFARSHGTRLVELIDEIHTEGRAPKIQPSLFALAVAASEADEEGRRLALSVAPRLLRTGYQLFTFLNYVQQFRGWGPALCKSVGRWYTEREVDKLAYQVVKYRQRDGWTHRDAMRQAHPTTPAEGSARYALFDWLTQQTSELPSHPELRIVEGYLRAQTETRQNHWAGLVHEYGLSWEMLPDAALKAPVVWEALLEKGLPQTALMRQLPRLTNLGLLDPLGRGSRVDLVCKQLIDAERLRKARVHPLQVLTAHRTYQAGAGRSQSWSPSGPVVDALDEAFYKAFGAVESTGKRFKLALDVSGSMGWGTIAGSPLNPREASAALALVTANTESSYEVVGFTSGSRRSVYGARRGTSAGLTPLSISPRQRLNDAIDAVSNLPFGGTDCALPIQDALQRQQEVDLFVVYTDSETWAGGQHVHQALREYRQRVNPDARLAVVGMTSTGFSIAEPGDPGSMDVVGFDLATPQLLSDFALGRI